MMSLDARAASAVRQRWLLWLIVIGRAVGLAGQNSEPSVNWVLAIFCGDAYATKSQ
jgi:hypothetical protein